MKSRGIVTFLMAMPVCLGTSAAIYFSENFTSGKLPNTINVSDEDGIAYDTGGIWRSFAGGRMDGVVCRHQRLRRGESYAEPFEAGLQKNRLSTAFFKVEGKGCCAPLGRKVDPSRHRREVSRAGDGGRVPVASGP